MILCVCVFLYFSFAFSLSFIVSPPSDTWSTFAQQPWVILFDCLFVCSAVICLQKKSHLLHSLHFDNARGEEEEEKKSNSPFGGVLFFHSLLSSHSATINTYLGLICIHLPVFNDAYAIICQLKEVNFVFSLSPVHLLSVKSHLLKARSNCTTVK